MLASAQRSARAVVAMVFLSVAAFAGCGKVSTRPDVPTGSVTVALATTGSDGATYQFPSGTELETVNGSGFNGFFPIDGSETVLTETIPVGLYQAFLITPNGSPLQLVRTLNGMSQTVPATWTDPQPFNFTVMQNMTTPIVLHFSVAGLGDITFQVGRLQVSIDVNSTTTTMPTGGQESATMTINSQTLAPGLGLETPLGLAVGEVDAVSISISLTGPFTQQTNGFVCAFGTLSAISAPTSSAAFTALVEELAGTPASFVSLCIFDAGTNDFVELTVVRFGAAPADQQAFLPGSNYQFSSFLEFQAGDIFDGTTLRLSELAGPITLDSGNGAFWNHSIFDSSNRLEASFGSISAGTFQLTP